MREIEENDVMNSDDNNRGGQQPLSVLMIGSGR